VEKKSNNNSALLIIVIAAALLIGGLVMLGVFNLPTVEQVSNPEASTKVATNDKLVTFSVVLIGLTGAIISMGAGLALLLWFLSREGTKISQLPDNPFAFSLNAEGNSIGTVVKKNSMLVSVLIGVGMVVTLVLIAIFIGAL
jgi:hypothetical protein